MSKICPKNSINFCKFFNIFDCFLHFSANKKLSKILLFWQKKTKEFEKILEVCKKFNGNFLIFITFYSITRLYPAANFARFGQITIQFKISEKFFRFFSKISMENCNLYDF